MPGNPYDIYGDQGGGGGGGGGGMPAAGGGYPLPAQFESDYGGAHKFFEHVPIIGEFLDNSRVKDAQKWALWQSQQRAGELQAGYGRNPLSRIGAGIYGAIDQAQTPAMLATTERAQQSLATSYAARGLAGRSGAASAAQAGTQMQLGQNLGGMRAAAQLEAIKGMERERQFRSGELGGALHDTYLNAQGLQGGDAKLGIMDIFKMAQMLGTGGASEGFAKMGALPSSLGAGTPGMIDTSDPSGYSRAAAIRAYQQMNGPNAYGLGPNAPGW